MPVSRRPLLLALPSLAAPALVRAQGTTPIRIGEINSYTAQPAFTLPYRSGWQMAVEEINATGGVLGRRLEVISRDDAGAPDTALRLAAELVGDGKVDLLAGGYLSNVGLALAGFAQQRSVLYVAGEPLSDALVWSQGNRWTFRLRPSTYMLAAMLTEDAAKLPARRWATVAPNYEYGQSAVKWFKTLMSARHPDIQWVGEQWPALGRIDAAATVQALADTKPDALFNATFGADLTNFVRAGNTRGVFENRAVVSMLTGEPEYLEPLGDEVPEGWIVTGYPGEAVDTPSNQAFAAKYRERFHEGPKMGSVVGYTLMYAIRAGITLSRTTDPAGMAAGFAGAPFGTPFGPASFRALDHQGTLGAYVGTLALRDGKGVMTNWRYVNGASVLPADDEVRKLRPAG